MTNVIKFQAPFERVKLYHDYPDISLYRAVIIQAIIDATNVSNQKKDKNVTVAANKWLFNDSEYQDFKEICSRADLEPYFVRKIASKIINLHHQQKLIDMDIDKTEYQDKIIVYITSTFSLNQELY
ncbi:MAG: hypothetical protein AB8B67_03860 [Rickettsiaceae bacterium]